ncbi:4'-phosphopantetheinyl transferase family protein [Kitasatospora sp. McL0602]|uniref:4'-phosphopantetheinyl transferase family protein n=1 Tax=Kitasatospora sp. McL0602 TaxID=3439530 RepID=UPI003F8CCF9C
MTAPAPEVLPAPGPDQLPPPLDVAVWALPIGPTPEPADIALLAPDERARMARYVRPEDAARFAAGRAATRRVLARHLGVPPGVIELGHQVCPGCGSPEHGPPRVASPQTSLSFSFSGAARHALIAVAPGGPVGVDIETVRPADLATLARHYLSPAEAAHLEHLPPGEQLTAFYRIWVRKEAVTKASGVGIVTDLRAVCVSPGSAGPVTVRHTVGDGPDTWTVTDLPVEPGVAAAVARPAVGRLRPDGTPNSTPYSTPHPAAAALAGEFQPPWRLFGTPGREFLLLHPTCPSTDPGGTDAAARR